MGRASSRKKAQRRAGPRSQADAKTEQATRRILARLQAMARETEERQERAAVARRIWSGGAAPVPAKVPHWPEGSLGGRFFRATFLREARKAPCLATADIPDAMVIAADSAHWNVATNALIRAVAYDGLGADHPAVSALLEVLAPIAEAEQASEAASYAKTFGIAPGRPEHKAEFPVQDGPVFLLGMCTLNDAVWAAIGDDSLTDIHGVLLPVLHDAVPSLDSQVVADALIGAFVSSNRNERPGDAETLERFGHVRGDALMNLVRSGAVPPGDVLPVGVRLLSALARLCRSDSASLLQPTA